MNIEWNTIWGWLTHFRISTKPLNAVYMNCIPRKKAMVGIPFLWRISPTLITLFKIKPKFHCMFNSLRILSSESCQSNMYKINNNTYPSRNDTLEDVTTLTEYFGWSLSSVCSTTGMDGPWLNDLFDFCFFSSVVPLYSVVATGGIGRATLSTLLLITLTLLTSGTGKLRTGGGIESFFCKSMKSFVGTALVAMVTSLVGDTVKKSENILNKKCHRYLYLTHTPRILPF